MTHPLLDLAGRWREEAAAYAADGALVPAERILERCAADLEAWLEALIPPAEAAAEAPHLAESTIRNRLSSGRLENWGKPGAPLVRRGDLFGVPRRGLQAVDPAVRRRLAGGR